MMVYHVFYILQNLQKKRVPLNSITSLRVGINNKDDIASATFKKIV